MRTSFFPLLLFFVLVASSCSVKPSSTEEQLVIAAATPTPEETCKPSTKHVEFENVSFDYDPCAFGDVKAKDVAEFRLPKPVNEYKPDFVEPRHVDFTFDSGPEGWKPTVDVFPLTDFPKMWAKDRSAAKDMVDEIQDLKTVLKNKDFRVNHQIPYLRYIDAHQDFQAHVKTGSFPNGNGIFFVTYWDTEVILINNDHLRYVFEGITSDGKYYVLAEIPISLSFLDDVTRNVETASLEGFTYDDLMEMLRTDQKDRKKPKYLSLKTRYDSYISAVTSRIEQTKPEDFVPSLTKLEELIASLKIAN